ncbi:MAG: hypothetical protein M5R36_18595 [Deltaproteobacteria bacterium]|nr:hypothetical protein [Deltaproteobacteria bacterium]
MLKQTLAILAAMVLATSLFATTACDIEDEIKDEIKKQAKEEAEEAAEDAKDDMEDEQDENTDDDTTLPDDTMDDDTGETESDPVCSEEDVCERMLDTGFFFEMETCLNWWADEDPEQCADYDGLFECACDCTDEGSEAGFEACMGQCNMENCPA